MHLALCWRICDYLFVPDENTFFSRVVLSSNSGNVLYVQKISGPSWTTAFFYFQLKTSERLAMSSAMQRAHALEFAEMLMLLHS
jgi:hypothetical protein